MTFSSLSPGLPFTARDGRPDRVDEVADRPGQGVVGVDVLDGGLDRAALAVAQHHDEPDAQLRDGELDAPLHGGARAADDVARHADHEQVADPLVEDQLGCHPRVGAADDDGERRLPLGQRREVFRLPPGVDELPAHEPLVALEQPGEHGVRVAGRGRLARRPGRSRQRPARPRRLPAR